jgi:hypothetical protein
VLALGGLVGRAGEGPPELGLFDFGPGFDLTQVQTAAARVSRVESAAGSALCVATAFQEPWPGITLRAPKGTWDLSKFDSVALDVRNAGTSRVTVNCRVDNPGADGANACVTRAVSLEPGKSATLKVGLKRHSAGRLGNRLFGLRGYPAAPGGPDTLDPAKVNQLLIFVAKPAAEHVFEVRSVRACGRYTPPTATVLDADPYFPLIDPFGQYRHRDWPGKNHSLEELARRREAERGELEKVAGPGDWDQYGGWRSGPKLEATGFFRAQKHRGKWWLVDPEGRLFFSHGVDCVLMSEVTAVEGRMEWFLDFPGDQDDFKEFVVPRAFALKGHYAGKSPRSFSFASANLKRKYGPAWRQACPEIVHRRLRNWGLNTIGMWSDEATRLQRRTPYVDAIGSDGSKLIEGSEGYWGKFPDVFDPSFRQTLRRSMARRVGKSAGDAWCIGYFADNELSWGDEMSLAAAALRSPPDQPAKAAFVAALKSQYKSIQALNEAWRASHESWEAFANHRGVSESERACGDLRAFSGRIAEQYFKTVRETIKEVAPNQLYLGCRFAWSYPAAAAAAAKDCDVVSYNLYWNSVADFQFPGGADVAVIIGEFHFGALDRGMFHTGLVPVSNQEERAAAYRNYVEGALRHPLLVGCHWFQYQDQPTTGRVYDEENYQIGLVDIADTPYQETVAACRRVAERMYQLRLGE